ncbi:MAG: DUF1934 domain-containing protein [Acidaminococcaceae bacterium]|nr:DUF1934 domain-containing protein [Acidaminococcaceae bacterium]
MQQAKITVEGISRSREGTSRLEVTSFGTYTEKNGSHYVRYEETEASGMAGTTTVIKWNASRVSLIRHGAYEMHQEFAEGSRYACDYRTPYLSIPLETTTKRVRVRKVGCGWELHMEYDLAYAAADMNRITAVIRIDLL